MSTPPIRFDDGAAYERFMGLWSRRVGEAFLDWLSPPPGGQWLDVGCGNGAFTELLVAECAPDSVDGVDPSEGQLAYARTRPALAAARFQTGDAMALPFPDNSFDAAVMPLVIFFVPEPRRGVTEMVRVVRLGGTVSAYAWDMMEGGFPYFPLQQAMREAGLTVPAPPSPEASRLETLRELWTDAGLMEVETHTITVQRTFADFADYWTTVLGGPSVGATLAALTPAAVADLQARVQAALPVAADGSISCSGRANAVMGRVAD
ncbi:MAG: methyltransferase protein [Moraxellaceae bacterium]|jgi:SAM-dependent methyltransferase|nr:methyltransferase protein [Moraxellaceae bacterium]